MTTAIPQNPIWAGQTTQASEAPVAMADAMDTYSKDTVIRGIGVFINLRASSSVSGKQLGDWIRGQFANVNVPVDFRVNQSKGTATDITFYVRGVSFAVNVADLKQKLPGIYKHYTDVWLPDTEGAN